MKNYDVIVIGAGPAGYVAAIRAAQLGLKTACIDQFTGKDGEPAPGGTCLNVGCIPSKALLDSSKHYQHVQHDFQDHGIQAENLSMDIEQMIARKDKVVKQLTGGVRSLFKSNKIEYLNGKGTLHADQKVTVEPVNGDETEELQGKHIILASGSVPIEIPNVEFDGEYIIDNVGALDMQAVPERLGVIGAGVIGLEMGSVWSRLGSEVTLLEALPDFLAGVDKDLSRQAAREFKKQGLTIKLNTKVKSAEVVDGEVLVTMEAGDENGDSETQMTFDRLLVSVGRRAYTDGLLADDAGVELTERGQIAVDGDCRTNIDNVWAVGDCVRGAMLAHKGSEEGVAVAERIAGKPGHINYETIPWVIYTDPEIAWVGKNEEELKEAGIDYTVGTFPFAANGRALAGGYQAGLAKIIADAENDTILGCHIMGPNASELIAECVVAMEFHGSSEDLARIVHAHPTLSEAVHEAALAVDKRAIHRG